MLNSIQGAVSWEMSSVTPILSDLCFPIYKKRIIEHFSLDFYETSLRTFIEGTQSDYLYIVNSLYILFMMMMIMMIGEEKLGCTDMFEFRIPNDVIIFYHFLALSNLFIYFLMSNHIFSASCVFLICSNYKPALSMWQKEARHELNDRINIFFSPLQEGCTLILCLVWVM